MFIILALLLNPTPLRGAMDTVRLYYPTPIIHGTSDHQFSYIVKSAHLHSIISISVVKYSGQIEYITDFSISTDTYSYYKYYNTDEYGAYIMKVYSENEQI